MIDGAFNRTVFPASIISTAEVGGRTGKSVGLRMIVPERRAGLRDAPRDRHGESAIGSMMMRATGDGPRARVVPPGCGSEARSPTSAPMTTPSPGRSSRAGAGPRHRQVRHHEVPGEGGEASDSPDGLVGPAASGTRPAATPTSAPSGTRTSGLVAPLLRRAHRRRLIGAAPESQHLIGHEWKEGQALRVIDVDSHLMEPPDWISVVNPALAAELPPPMKLSETLRSGSRMRAMQLPPESQPEEPLDLRAPNFQVFQQRNAGETGRSLRRLGRESLLQHRRPAGLLRRAGHRRAVHQPDRGIFFARSGHDGRAHGSDPRHLGGVQHLPGQPLCRAHRSAHPGHGRHLF